MGIEQPMNLLELQHKHSNDTNNLDSSQKQELIDGMVSEMQANLKLANTADTLGQFELDAVDVAEFSRMYEEKLVSFLSTSRTSDELLKVQL
ncbi:MAG: hypothetical protein H6767_01950 [Candidatus Peribacteria bacterium]|nr:MAG: hypothetical protein H6767_01950 [Candidatus Peribacteria bacterium]